MTPPDRPAWLRSVFPGAVVVMLLMGAVFAIQLVAELAAPPGASGHHDMLAFWAAGHLILEGRTGDLYDAASLTAIQRTVIPVPIGMNGYMPFINPPLAAAAFAPLAALAEPAARILWAALNMGLAAVAGLWLTRKMTGRERLAGGLLVATSYPMVHALAEGQWSILLLVGGLASLAAARRGAWGPAGAALAVLWLKPQFIVLPLLALIVGRRWRAIAAAAGTGLIAVIAAVPFTGLSANLTYVAYLAGVVTSHFAGAGPGSGIVWQGDLASTEGINGLLVGWFGQGSVGFVNVGWAAAVVVIGAIYTVAARSTRPGFDTAGGRAMLAAGIAVVLLVNPNQFVQDCVLVFLALDAIGPLAKRWQLPALAATVAVADLTWLDLQLPPLHLFAMVLIAGTLWVCRRAMAAPRPALRTGAAATGP